MSSVLGTPRAEAPYLILDTLAAAGWSISIEGDPDGIKVKARRRRDLVEATGRDLAEVVLLVAAGCARKTHPCPKGDGCALNDGAVTCFHCGRNWPPDETWDKSPVESQ